MEETINGLVRLFVNQCTLTTLKMMIFAIILYPVSEGHTQCSGFIYDSGGQFGTYSNNEDVTNTFSAPAGSIMVLTINTLDLEENHDFLYIYDGNSTSAPLMYALTGYTPPQVISSTGKDITLRFVSDDNYVQEGWNISLSCYAMNDCATLPSNGLIAHYDFKELSGNIIHDISGYETPLNLVVADPSNVEWNSGCGLTIQNETEILSVEPASKIISALKNSNALTIEAWVQPSSSYQSGPARIVTISDGSANRNVTLGQSNTRYTGRLRTTDNSVTNNGMPDVNTGTVVSTGYPQHIVYSWDAISEEHLIYVDGVLEFSGTRAGDLNNWNDFYYLNLVNEVGASRTWLGTIYSVAIYDKVLNESEILTNFFQGSCCTGNDLFDAEFDCNSGVEIETFITGLKNDVPKTLNFNNLDDIDSVLVEIVYKSSNPGSTIYVQDDNTISYAGTYEELGLNAYLYTFHLPATSYVSYTNTSKVGNAQSLMAYVYRSGQPGKMYTSTFTSIGGHNSVQSFKIPLPPRSEVQDINVVLPVSELTYDNRLLNFNLTAGTSTKSLSRIWGSNGVDFPDGCCIDTVKITLEDVPNNVSFVEVEVESPSGSGQSYVIGGVIYAEIECFENEICEDNIDNDNDGLTDCEDPDCGYILNREFNNGLTNWDLYVQSGSSANASIDEFWQLEQNSAFIDISQIGSTATNWHIQFSQDHLSFEDQRIYEIIFDAKATGERPMVVALQLNQNPWTSFFWESVNLTTEATTYTFDFTAPQTMTNTIQMYFGLGESLEDVWIDNVQFKEKCVSCSADAGSDQTQCQNAIFQVEGNEPSSGALGTWSVVSGSATTSQSWNDRINTFSIPPGITVLRWTVAAGSSCSEYDEITLTNTSSCSVDCIDPLNINGDVEDDGNISSYPLSFNSSNAALISGDNNPTGWGERYGANAPNTSTFNGAYYIDTSPNSSGDPLSGDHVIYLKGDQFCLSPLSTNAGLACGKTYSFSVWVAAYTYSGTQQDAPFALEYTANAASGTPAPYFTSVQLMAPASQNWNNLNWMRYDFEITLPEDGFEYSDFYFTSYSDDHGIVVDDLCITVVDTGTEAIAGADASGCSNVFNLQANTPKSGHTGTWSVTEGDISLSSLNDPNAVATINSGSVGKLTWTISDGSCSASDDIILSYQDLPPLMTNDVDICNGASANVSVKGCTGHILWSNGETSSSVAVSPTSTTTYSVTCTETQSTNLLQNGNIESTNDLEFWENWADAAITFDPGHVHSGEKAILLDANNGNWSGIGQSIDASPGEHFTLTFWAKSTNSNAVPYIGMRFFDSSWQSLTEIDQVEIKSIAYQQYTISGIAPLNSAYIQIGGGVSSTAKFYLDDFMLTKGSACERTADVTVTVNDAPLVSVTNDGPITCTNTSVMLTANPSGMNYEWSNGATGESVNVNATGTYFVTITNEAGCSAIASTEVQEVITGPNAAASVSNIITCDTPSATLTAGPSGMIYAWSNGATDQTISVNTGGYYTVSVTDVNGCSGYTTVYVIEDTSTPYASLENIETCEGETSILSPELCETYPVIDALRPLPLSGWRNIYGNDRSPLKNDGELCFTLDSCHLSSAQMIGLNTDPNTNNSFNTIDFAVYVYIRSDQNRTLLQIRESGTSMGNVYNAPGTIEGSTICVRRTGTTIEYLLDGLVIFTSNKTSTGDLYYDHSVYSGNGIWANGFSRITDIQLCGDIELDYVWSTDEISKTIEVSTADIYYLTITDAKGCENVASSNVIVHSNPEAIATNNGPGSCTNPTITLMAQPPGMSYLWENGATSQSNSVSVGGTYTVTVTNSHLCSSIASTLVEFPNNPIVEVTGNTILCSGETTTLSPTTGGVWITSDPSVAVVSNTGDVASIGPGTVTFTFMDANTGCISDPTEVITIIPELSVSISYDDGLCVKEGSKLSASPQGGLAPYQYTWSGPNGMNAVGDSIAISDFGNYYVTVTDAAGCTASSSGYIYEQFDPFIFTLSTEICEGQDVTLTVNSGIAVSYEWDSNADNATSAGVTVYPSPPSTTYFVTVTNNIGCSTIASATIDVNAKSKVSITGETELCIGETTQLSPASGGIWTSSNTNIAGVSNSGLVTALGAGSVTFVFTDSLTNCDSDHTNSILVEPQTPVFVTGPAILCEGESTTLSPASGGVWQSSDESVAIVTNDGTVTTVGAGTASFIFTNSSTGCSSNATSAIVVNPRPEVSILGPDELCVGNQTFLTPTSGGIWESSNPEIATITNTGIVTALTAGISEFTFTSSFGCTSYETATITIEDNQEILISGNPILCEDESQTMTASIAGGEWSSSNPSVASIDPATGEVTGIAAGTVIIAYDNSSSGCYLNSEMTVEIKTTPTVNISGSVEICTGEISSVYASTGGTWASNDENVAVVSNNGTVVGISTGYTTFTFTADNGCSSIETGVLTVNPGLDVSIDFNGSECMREDMQLTALVNGGSADFEYAWNGPDGFISEQQMIDVVIDGNYYLEVTDGAGCSTHISAFVYEEYDPFIVALDSEICEGGSTTLSVNSTSSAQYQWSANTGNQTTQSITVFPTSPSSIYTVTITNSAGCTSVATSEITVHPVPEIAVTGNTSICLGETTTLSTASEGFWTSNNIAIASVTNEGIVTGLSSGSATFTFRDAATDCISEASEVISVGSNTSVTLYGSDQLCVGVPSTVSASIAGGTWISNNNSVVTVNNLGELNPITQGTATISYIFNSGECYEDETIEVMVNNTPAINLNGPSTICEGENTFLIPTSGGIWTSSDESIATVSNIGIVTGVSEGNVTFTFTSGFGCSKSLSTSVTVLASPAVNVIGPSEICIDESTSLSPTTGGIWMSNNPSVASVNSTGIVTGINEGEATFTFIEFTNGCTSSESLTISVHDPPSVSIPVNDELCIGEQTSITPALGGQWISSDPNVASITNNGTITAIAPGSASFTFTSFSSGCSSEASASVIVDGKPSISLIGPDDLCVGELSNILPNSGGTWKSTDPNTASITDQGEITALGVGTVRFIFTSNTTGCTSDSSTILTINETIDVEITGDDRICVGAITTLSPTSGGTWESSNDNIATVSNSGVVTAHAPGTAIFTFNSNSNCLSNPSSEVIIDPIPNPVFTESSSICVGTNTTLSPTIGGVWESSDPTVATVTNDGTITGIGPGTAVFTFTNSSTGCSAVMETVLYVFNGPEISIAGGSELCLGETTTMLPSTGGFWTSNHTSIASITSTGTVTALGEGTATFTFTEVGSGCVASVSDPITVLPKPIAVIIGNDALCVGESTTLAPSSGGSWMSTNEAVATVTNTGFVTTLSQGSARFTFISNEGCSSDESSPIVVYGQPSIFIDGEDQLCIGQTTQMSPAVGGTWESTNTNVATISNTGLVTSVGSGEVRFIFTETNSGCVSEESDIVTVLDKPQINLIGPDEICVGSTTNLVPTVGGVWTSLSPDIATIANNGEITGIAPGTAIFQFTDLVSGCESDASELISVNPAPGISFLGNTELCIGEFSSITPDSGGTWMSTNPEVASISNSGIIEAHAQGSTNFQFTEASTGCVSALSTTMIVNGPPTTFVTGGTIICIGSTSSLSPSTGGTWTSLQPSIADVTNDGIVTGISAGIASFVFVDETTGCISDSSTSVEVGNEVPVSITGESEICLGYTTKLSPSSGGVWVSSNPNIAIVSNSGVVTGKAPGKVSFEFIDAASGCTSGGVTDEITIRSCLNHDFKVAVANEVIMGNLSTNDHIAPTALYSNTPILITKPNGELPSLTINTDGTYVFQSNVEGKYIYHVPVCLPPFTNGCPQSIFEINVVDDVYSVSNPVSNLEFATTYMGQNDSSLGLPIAINTLENDDCVYTGGCNLDVTTVSILENPSNGTTAIDANGVITYTPNAEFIGLDTLAYQVCVDGEAKCSQSRQIITVNHNTALNSLVAADDFGFTLRGESLSGNVRNNDSDPEGDDLAVVPMGSSIAPVSVFGGEYYVNAAGDYVFTPDNDFTGATEIVYTICDNNMKSACRDATLHILVFDYLTLDIRVYLEGAMMQNEGVTSTISGRPLMRDNLRVSPYTGENLIPRMDPYSVLADEFVNTPSKYLHIGPGTMAENREIIDSVEVFGESGDDAIVDWVHVELRSKEDMTQTIATRSGLLQRDGDIVDIDGTSNLKFQGVNVDSFYVAVKHRSHLGVMSLKVSNSELIDFTALDFPTFDFGTSLGDVNDYTGLAQKSSVVPGYNVLWAGDFDSNGKIKFTNPTDDQNVMFMNVLLKSADFLINYDNAYGYLTGDYNMDGKVKFTNPGDDLNYLFSQLLLYPNNTSFLSNFNSLVEQIPK